MKKIRKIIVCLSFILLMTGVPVKDAGMENVYADEIVYVTATGSRYHTHKCGNGNFYQDSLSNALARGLTPCEKCYSGSGGSQGTGENVTGGSTPEPEPAPVRLTINRTRATLVKGQSVKLKAAGATETVKWSTDKPRVAAVTAGGKVVAKAKGKAVITASANGKTKKCTITVEEPKLSAKSVQLTVTGTKTLKLKGCIHSVKWSSSRPSVAKVSKGKVTAKKPGTAVIKAKVHGKTYQCRVTVKKPVIQKLSLSASNLSMGINQEKIIRIKVSPSNILKYYDYEVSSSNPDILEVADESNGRIVLTTGDMTGTAVVKVKINKKVLSCKVTVTPPEITSLTLSKTLITMDPYSNMAELYAQGKAGTATVTLRVGNKTAACKVTVQED